jgi:hypothetical protein
VKGKGGGRVGVCQGGEEKCRGFNEGTIVGDSIWNASSTFSVCPCDTAEWWRGLSGALGSE